MLIWEKIGRAVSKEGTTITYAAKEAPWLVIESRKTHIPHANGIGTWDHTFYYVLEAGTQTKQCVTLKEAKAFAEEVAHG